MNDAVAERRRHRREIISWCLFDFANSPFTTVIITVVYAVYFSKVVATESGAELWAAALAVSNFLIILSAPVIGALADRLRRKKRFLFASYLVCIVATAALFFMKTGDVVGAMLLVVVANTAFATGENLIGGFLPEIARPAEIPRISALGWAVGYVGGLFALGVSLWLASFESDVLTRSVCLVVAAVFLIGGAPTFLFVRERHEGEALGPIGNPIRTGFAEVIRTWKRRASMPQLFHFLAAYLVFSIGIYGVIGFAGIYGENLFGLKQVDIIGVFIVLQFVAAAGALAAGRIARNLGVLRTLELTLFLWIAGGSLALFTSSPAAYWAIAILAGFAIGASLPTSRAAVALLTPARMEAEVFGFWGLYTRIAAALAPAGNFVLLRATRPFLGEPQNLRAGIVYFVAAFVVGLVLLRRVDAGGALTAGGPVPSEGEPAPEQG
ncbi:MAG: MFS transporter [Planctomycetota bacterium]